MSIDLIHFISFCIEVLIAISEYMKITPIKYQSNLICVVIVAMYNKICWHIIPGKYSYDTQF